MWLVLVGSWPYWLVLRQDLINSCQKVMEVSLFSRVTNNSKKYVLLREIDYFWFSVLLILRTYPHYFPRYMTQNQWGFSVKFSLQCAISLILLLHLQRRLTVERMQTAAVWSKTVWINHREQRSTWVRQDRTIQTAKILFPKNTHRWDKFHAQAENWDSGGNNTDRWTIIYI